MKLSSFLFFSSLAVSILWSCSSVSADKKDKFSSMKNDDKIVLDQSQLNMKKIKVSKPDGSLQCSQGKKISPEEMQKELKGLTVFSNLNIHDGRMRMQMCGTPTGFYNVYEILEGELEKAKILGFELWSH